MTQHTQHRVSLEIKFYKKGMKSRMECDAINGQTYASDIKALG